MALTYLKPSYMTGLDYLTHLQNYGESIGGMQMINRRLKFGNNLFSKDLYAHYGCVNAIEFSNDGQWMISGGDDKRVLFWNMNKTLSLSGSHQPNAMKSEHNSNIFCLAFNMSHTKLLSAGNDEQVILHDIKTRESLDVFTHQEAIYGLSADPMNDSLFATSCDDGRVVIWDIRQGLNEPYTLAQNNTAYHAVMHNPIEPRFLATANAKEGVCLYDIRKPLSYVTKYGSSLLTPSAMSVRFNTTGNQLLALRRRLPPVLYDVTSTLQIAEFDHPEYYNSCTMKSCCFAGERDQYILSGSDDFKLYIWKIPDKIMKKSVCVRKTHFILRGHRSIVNQVRYNNAYGIVASSGVEKIIKLWSSFPISNSDRGTDESRKVFSHEEYINLVLHSGQFMTHDYSHRSTREDPRMMAFFDSLVQRDIEGWTSDSNDASEKTKEDILFEIETTESSTSTCSSSSSDDELQNITHGNKKCPGVETESNQTQEQTNLQSIAQKETAGNNEGPSTNASSTNGENDSIHLASDSEVFTLRRLFSNNEGSNASQILTDTSGVAICFFPSSDGANNRVAGREEAINRLLSTREAGVGRFACRRLPNNRDIDNNEEFHPSSDRISQLIAQKRRVHQLKIARKSMQRDNILTRKQHKRIERLRKRTGNAISPGIAYKNIKADLPDKNESCPKDKRKLLRKKRAKLSKNPNLEGDSTDSDLEGTNIKNCTSSVGNSSANDVNAPTEHKSSFKKLSCNIHIEERLSRFKRLCDGITPPTRDSPSTSEDLAPCSASTKKDLSETNGYADNGDTRIPNAISDNKNSDNSNIRILPITSETSTSHIIPIRIPPVEIKSDKSLNIKGTETLETSETALLNQSASSEINKLNETFPGASDTGLNGVESSIVNSNSTSSTFFPISGSKRGSRNYRKRSIDDENDG